MNKFETATTSALKDLNATDLAEMADVRYGHGPETPGTLMLTSIRDDVLEQVAGALNGCESVEDAVFAVEAWRDGDGPSEVADGAPDVYTVSRMEQLMDLQAWDEDTSEFGDSPDIITAAGYALYGISSRLVDALVGAVIETLENMEDEEDTED